MWFLILVFVFYAFLYFAKVRFVNNKFTVFAGCADLCVNPIRANFELNIMKTYQSSINSEKKLGSPALLINILNKSQCYFANV